MPAGADVYSQGDATASHTTQKDTDKQYNENCMREGKSKTYENVKRKHMQT